MPCPSRLASLEWFHAELTMLLARAGRLRDLDPSDKAIWCDDLDTLRRSVARALERENDETYDALGPMPPPPAAIPPRWTAFDADVEWHRRRLPFDVGPNWRAAE